MHIRLLLCFLACFSVKLSPSQTFSLQVLQKGTSIPPDQAGDLFMYIKSSSGKNHLFELDSAGKASLLLYPNDSAGTLFLSYDDWLVEKAGTILRHQVEIPLRLYDGGDTLIFTPRQLLPSAELAFDHIALAQPRLLCTSGFTGRSCVDEIGETVPCTTFKHFEETYGIKVISFGNGCRPPPRQEIQDYNAVISHYLDQQFGNAWRKELAAMGLNL